MSVSLSRLAADASCSLEDRPLAAGRCLGERAPLHQFDRDLGQLVDRLVHLQRQDLRALAKPLEMLAQAEEVGRLVVRVPVAADALEDRRAVVERVGHDPDFCLAQRDDVALEVRVRCRHGSPLPGGPVVVD